MATPAPSSSTTPQDLADEDLIDRAKAALLPGEHDVVGEVARRHRTAVGDPDADVHVVVLDCGVKRNIIRSLTRRGVKVTVVPYGTPYSRIAEIDPDGVIVSPGPGDPANLDDGLDVVRVAARRRAALLRDLPRPPTPGPRDRRRHRQAQVRPPWRQPAGDRRTDRPCHDHRPESQLPGGRRLGADRYRVAGGARNLNDGSVEGLAHDRLPVLSVQFHPEASPGPVDSNNMFDAFLDLIRDRESVNS